MSDVEQNLQEIVSEVVESPVAVEAVQENLPPPVERVYNQVEQEQMAKGWNPNGPKSAEQFESDGKLYDEIKRSHKEIKEMREAVAYQQKLLTGQAELQYQRALADIQANRVEAIKLGDVDAVSTYDRALVDNQQRLQELQRNNQPILTADQQACMERHADIFKNQDKSWAADQIRSEIAKKEQSLLQNGVPVDEVVRIVENDIITMKKVLMSPQFPSEAATPPIPKFNPVSPSTPAVTAPKQTKIQFDDLPKDAQQMYYICQRKGFYKNKEEYIDEQYKLGAIK